MEGEVTMRPLQSLVELLVLQASLMCALVCLEVLQHLCMHSEQSRRQKSKDPRFRAVCMCINLWCP